MTVTFQEQNKINSVGLIYLNLDGYAMKDIIFVWKDSQPVAINDKLEMPDFVLTSHNSSTCLRKFSKG